MGDDATTATWTTVLECLIASPGQDRQRQRHWSGTKRDLGLIKCKSGQNCRAAHNNFRRGYDPQPSRHCPSQRWRAPLLTSSNECSIHWEFAECKCQGQCTH